MHCTCTVQNMVFVPPFISSAERCNSASGGVEAHCTLVHHATHTHTLSDLQFLPACEAHAAMLLLCLWGATVKMKVCLNWGFGMCKGEFVQSCVCTSKNQIKHICCVFVWWVAALKMKVCLDWGFWQMQKGINSSLCLHIHKPKKLSQVLQNKQPSSYMSSHHT